MKMLNDLVVSCFENLNEIQSKNRQSEEKLFEYLNSLTMLCSYFDQQSVLITSSAIQKYPRSHILYELKYRLCIENNRFEEAYDSIKNAANILWDSKITYGDIAVKVGKLSMRFDDYKMIEEQARRLFEINANNDALNYYFEEVVSKVKGQVSKSLVDRFKHK